MRFAFSRVPSGLRPIAKLARTWASFEGEDAREDWLWEKQSRAQQMKIATRVRKLAPEIRAFRASHPESAEAEAFEGLLEACDDIWSELHPPTAEKFEASERDVVAAIGEFEKVRKDDVDAAIRRLDTAEKDRI